MTNSVPKGFGGKKGVFWQKNTDKLAENAVFLHFFAEIFGHIKKKQYFCTRFRSKGAIV